MNLLKKIFFLLLFSPMITFAVSDHYYGLSPTGEMVKIPNPNNEILPSPFPVYSDGNVVINHPAPGFNKINIPTDNSYKGSPGCYIMCYSHLKGLYEVGVNIYAHGMIRIPGVYKNTVCEPMGAEHVDISDMQRFKDLCNQKVRTCNKTCWAGGATGGWYGMQGRAY